MKARAKSLAPEVIYAMRRSRTFAWLSPLLVLLAAPSAGAKPRHDPGAKQAQKGPPNAPPGKAATPAPAKGDRPSADAARIPDAAKPVVKTTPAAPPAPSRCRSKSRRPPSTTACASS